MAREESWGRGLLGCFGLFDAIARERSADRIRENERQEKLAYIASGSRYREREVAALETIAAALNKETGTNTTSAWN